jgi:hypothetical protein
MFGKKAQQRRMMSALGQLEEIRDNTVVQLSEHNGDRLTSYVTAQRAQYGDQGPAEIVQPMINALDMHNAAVDAYENGNLGEAEGRCRAVIEWLDEVAPRQPV